MNFASEVMADTPFLWWRQNDSSLPTADDSSGNGRTGTYTNSPTLQQASLINSDPAAKSVLYDAISQYCINGATVNQSIITVEVWWDFNGTLPSAGLNGFVAGFLQGDVGSSTDKALGIDWNGHAIFDCYDGSHKKAVSSTVLTAGSYQLVGTNDGTTSRIYVNGTEVGNIACAGTYTGYTSNNIMIAGRDTTVFVTRQAGRRQEFIVYTNALSPTRILAHYNAGIAAPEGGTILPSWPRVRYTG